MNSWTPEPHDPSSAPKASALLPGDPFPWAPQPKIDHPEPSEAPAGPPAEDVDEELFPHDLGAGD